MAAKPTAPVSINCSALSVSGNTHTVECDLRTVGKESPKSIRLAKPQGKGVTLLSSEPMPARGGGGKWRITLELDDNKPVTLVFEFQYAKKSFMRAGAVYDPKGTKEKTAAPKKGKIKKGANGGAVQEFPSK